MTVADRIAQWLEENDITHAFGIVGGGNVVLWDAIVRRGFTEIISCHHEQAAAMAAGYYWRVSGRLALTLVTTGGGSTNALTGVMAAWMDSVALLVIAGNENSDALAAPTRVKGTQGYDSAQVAGPMTKWSGSWDAEDHAISEVLDHYKDVALLPRQGPVWLNLPKDRQSARYD